MTRTLFPYYGGKRRVATLVWDALGTDLGLYVEPFAGSAAVFFGTPDPVPRIQVLGDADALVVNFWRACRADPDALLCQALQPSNEVDLWAWNEELTKRRGLLHIRLVKDPYDYCLETAARWWWFLSTTLVPLGARERPSAAIPPAGRNGLGVHAPINRKALSDVSRCLRGVIVRCGDWSRCVSKESAFGTRQSKHTVGVFLDPPYRKGSREADCYAVDTEPAPAAARWAREHGEEMRIVFCGYDKEHSFPGWRSFVWRTAAGGFRLEGVGRRECLWFSPMCLPVGDDDTGA